MRPVNHLFIHFKKYGMAHKPLYTISIMLFFWSIFDGILSFIVPIVITDSGVSTATMGVILGSSSVAGAIFDFVLSKFATNTHYRRIFLFMIILSFAFPVVLFKANTLAAYLLAMSIWGAYFDLMAFGSFDFVSRETKPDEHASSFGVMDVFRILGYTIAPIIAGILIVTEKIDVKPFAASLIFLGLATLVYFAILFMGRKDKAVKERTRKKRNIFEEIALWRKVGKKILPILIFTMMLSVFDSFFWTIGPIYSENLRSLQPFGGLLLTVYMFPSLIMGWFVGSIVNKFGQKNTAFLAFSLGTLVLIPLAVAQSVILILAIVFVSACMSAIAWPAVSGTYADYISEDMPVEAEIEGVADFFNNAGFIVGPMLAGFLADKIGISTTFGALGLGALIITLILKKSTPKTIKMNVKA